MAGPAKMTVIPDVIGEVRGYRTWNLINGGMLDSHTRGYLWHNGVNFAVCPYFPFRDHPVPDMLCGCGLYSADAPHHPRIPRGIFGVVESWGGIVEHENGVQRAGKARIAALWLDPVKLTRTQRANLRRNYPDVRMFTFRWRMIRAYPPGKTCNRLYRISQPAFVLTPAAAMLSVVAAVTGGTIWDVTEAGGSMIVFAWMLTLATRRWGR